MVKNRFRLQYKFWLDANKADEHALAELIDQMKQERAFTRAVRDGLRLIADLWRGNLDVLLELFPDVEQAFYARFQAREMAPFEVISGQLDELLTLVQTAPPSLNETLAKRENMAFTAMTVPPVGNPAADDDGLATIELRPVTGGDTAQNFLNSISALSG